MSRAPFRGWSLTSPGRFRLHCGILLSALIIYRSYILPLADRPEQYSVPRTQQHCFCALYHSPTSIPDRSIVPPFVCLDLPVRLLLWLEVVLEYSPARECEA